MWVIFESQAQSTPETKYYDGNKNLFSSTQIYWILLSLDLSIFLAQEVQLDTNPVNTEIVAVTNETYYKIYCISGKKQL